MLCGELTKKAKETNKKVILINKRANDDVLQDLKVIATLKIQYFANILELNCNGKLPY